MPAKSPLREGPKATQTRAAVLDAALTLFAKRGPREPSLREVAREAGVSLGALQYYFPTREALLQGVMSKAMESFSTANPLDHFPDTDVELLLRHGLRANVSWARAHPRLQRLGTHLALEQPDHEWPGEAEVAAEINRRVRVAQESGQLRDFDRTMLLTLVEVVLNGWSGFRAHYARNLPHLDDAQLDGTFIDFFVDLILDGLRPRGGGRS